MPPKVLLLKSNESTMAKRKIKWANGDIFAIPLADGSFAIGQALDLMMVNQMRVALYDERFTKLEDIELPTVCQPAHLISLVACSREQIDYGVWRVLGNKSVTVPIHLFPNEQFRQRGWVGAKHYDAGLVENFFDAFYALKPWDDWFNPNYLNEFLVSIDKKPNKLWLITS